MMLLQPQVCLLDKFVIQQEAIPNLMPIGIKPNHMVFNNNRIVDNVEQVTKNVCKTSNPSPPPQFDTIQFWLILEFPCFLISDSKYVNFKNSNNGTPNNNRQ